MPDAAHTPTLAPTPKLARGLFIAAAVAATACTALVAIGARSWIDRPFAGFFLRADRTIAAIGRTTWSDVAPEALYDRTVLAVDGVRVTDSDAVMRRVDAKPVGSPLVYTLTDGTTPTTVTVHSRRFTAADYWAVFGAYTSTGLCYVLLALVAAWTMPSGRVGRALLVLGGIGGIFMLTAADLYPPASSLRMHLLAATLLPAALLQFALAVGDTRGGFADGALPVVWAVALAAAASVQLAVGDAASVHAVRATCDAALGLALVSATVGLASRVRIADANVPLVVGTALFGLGVPAIVCLVAGVFGGVPQNASATLAFLFPLGTSAALWRRDPAFTGMLVAPTTRSL